jgi:hypothetical protein
VQFFFSIKSSNKNLQIICLSLNGEYSQGQKAKNKCQNYAYYLILPACQERDRERLNEVSHTSIN